MLAIARKLLKFVPATEARVPLNTSVVGNERIRAKMLARLEAVGRDAESI